MKRRLAAVAMAAVAIVAASACTSEVGDFDTTSEAYGINDGGYVVGVSLLPGTTIQDNRSRGFVRQPDRSIVQLDPLPGDVTSVARQINEAGTIVGWSNGTAVAWDTTGHITSLGFAAGPNDINDHGVIVGERYREAGDTQGHAFVYDPAVGHPVKLPELPGAVVSSAWGLNNAGQAVGSVGFGGTGIPVRWDLVAGTVTPLAATTGLDFAFDISDAGVIIGTVPSGAWWSAAIWTPGSAGPTALGAGLNSRALAMNEDGTVVGDSNQRAFRWRVDTGIVWLTGSGTPSVAYAINASGGVVGDATVSGLTTAVFLYPEH